MWHAWGKYHKTYLPVYSTVIVRGGCTFALSWSSSFISSKIISVKTNKVTLTHHLSCTSSHSYTQHCPCDRDRTSQLLYQTNVLHTKIALLCTECLYASICSLTLSLPLVYSWHYHSDNFPAPDAHPMPVGIYSQVTWLKFQAVLPTAAPGTQTNIPLQNICQQWAHLVCVQNIHTWGAGLHKDRG